MNTVLSKTTLADMIHISNMYVKHLNIHVHVSTSDTTCTCTLHYFVHVLSSYPAVKGCNNNPSRGEGSLLPPPYL